MVHEITYDAVNEVIVLSFKGDYLLSDVKPIEEKLKELMVGKPNRQLVIMLNSDHTIENRETREAAINSLALASDVALVGGGAINRMVAKVMLKSGAVKLSGDFFKNFEEAMIWLKSKR